MAEPTLRRGAGDTTAAGRGGARVHPRAAGLAALIPLIRSGSRRALRVAIVVAVLLHAPLVPNPLFAWVDLLLSVGDGQLADYDGGETIIPLDLDLLANDPVAASQAPSASATAEPPPAPSAAPPPSSPSSRPSATPVADAGPPDAGDLDAGPPKRDPDDAAPVPPPADTGPPKLRDPLSVAGAPGRLAAKDPNVQVLISGDRLRKHELGEWFGRILTTIPEWQSFFKDTPIDPIRDLNHLLIAGPQFRDSSKVVAIMDYRVPEPAMRGALDVLVDRTKGEWLKDSPVPAARAKADRADRIFALVPQKRLLVVLPLDQRDSLEKLKSIKPFNRSSQAGIVISMLTPANAFKKIYKLPPTLKWMRLTVTPTKDGGADLALTVGDSSAEDAAKHAEELSSALNAVRSLDLGITKVDVLDEVKFTAESDVIWTRLHVQNKQLKLIMGFVEQALKDQVEARKKKAKDPP